MTRPDYRESGLDWMLVALVIALAAGAAAVILVGGR